MHLYEMMKNDVRCINNSMDDMAITVTRRVKCETVNHYIVKVRLI